MSTSLSPECLPAKEKYDACFIRWYTEKFLRGERKEDETCQKLFQEYSQCLKKALESKGISKMLDEARKNTDDGDLIRRAP
ncbi:hypothetical protein ABW19_dt0210587 [Dactylella cylindrospora]|nr:hypothetical protein ABW19_dt0210587 [Dactylella cylindrospora]